MTSLSILLVHFCATLQAQAAQPGVATVGQHGTADRREARTHIWHASSASAQQVIHDGTLIDEFIDIRHTPSITFFSNPFD